MLKCKELLKAVETATDFSPCLKPGACVSLSGHTLGKNLNELPDNLGPPKRSSSDDVGGAAQENQSGD